MWREMDEEMDEEMDDTDEEVFTAEEVDPDYEFDAYKYFDFTRDESSAEACEAELWFETAKSYPPSPFVAKLVHREDIILEAVSTSSKSRLDEHAAVSSVSHAHFSYATSTECSGINGARFNSSSEHLTEIQDKKVELPKDAGLIFCSHKVKEDPKDKTEFSLKPVWPRSSTLMKPTASQLAKKNTPQKVDASRFLVPLIHNNERSLNSSSGAESQAAKRQKLESGHLCKAADVKQQTNFVHKASKKDGIVCGNYAHPKPKLTIPREPELVTARRARRIRPNNGSESEQTPFIAHRFKARPLNRKILEAPSPLPKRTIPVLPEFQEFHLKTAERAMQHISAVSSSSLDCNNENKGLQKSGVHSFAKLENEDFRRQDSVIASKHNGEATNHFKARSLNKKIFSSKGEIGVFHNSKRETTKPTEFNFHTEKGMQHNPPVELFSKLSLASELRPSNRTTQLKLPQPTCGSTKGLKENRCAYVQHQQEIIHSGKAKQSRAQVGNIQFGGEWSTRFGPNRDLNIRQM